MMYACEYCGATYTSPLAAALCEDEDRLDDLHARRNLRGRATGK